ncbi:MAG: sulfatase-like hydrolase/transferase [Acidimicrobiales bacterium]
MQELGGTTTSERHPVDPARARPDEPRADARGPSTRRWLVDAAVIFGLAGVAITQPLLDLLGRNPPFFVAGHYEPTQIIWFAVVVGVVPAVTVYGATALAGLVHQRGAGVYHGIGVGLLAGLLVLMLCRTLRLDGLVYVVPVVVLLAIAIAVLEWRSRIARQFMAYLAVGNLAFVVLFLTSSPTARLIGAGDEADQPGHVAVPSLDGPVVLIVLDEFPVTAIMRGDGTIIDTRYPNLARLAEETTWFRNAAGESRTTYVATPSILTGVRAGEDELPILEDHPRNYFSLFGDRYPVNRYELVTDMCPSEVCESPPPQPMAQLIDDASIVYQHRVLPPAVRDSLPPLDTGWGDFGDDMPVGANAGVDAVETPPSTQRPGPMDQVREKTEEEIQNGQVSIFRNQIELIDAQPSINFLHLVLPHHPYRLTPWGDGQLPVTRLPDEISSGRNKLPATDDPAYDFMFRQLYPLQAMQIGAVDELLGEMIDHLEATGAWDESLVVVMSDHGIDMTAPGFTRRVDETNTDEIFRMPLFIKAPGQTEGLIDDAPASTVDVLPSIVDLLDIDTDWEFEGHSLFDSSEPSIDRRVRSDVEAAFTLAAAHRAQFPRGEDWVSLAAVGQGEDLVGNPVGDYRVGAPSDLRWKPEAPDVLEDLSLADDPVPYIMEGDVSGGDERPPELVVAVNGTLAGTLGGYLPDGKSWRFTGYVAPLFRDGRNEVVAYEVERTGKRMTLHPLAN